jgi:hypothetical protein
MAVSCPTGVKQAERAINKALAPNKKRLERERSRQLRRPYGLRNEGTLETRLVVRCSRRVRHVRDGVRRLLLALPDGLVTSGPHSGLIRITSRSPLQSSISWSLTMRLAFSIASASSRQVNGSHPMKCPSSPTVYARYSPMRRFRTLQSYESIGFRRLDYRACAARTAGTLGNASGVSDRSPDRA